MAATLTLGNGISTISLPDLVWEDEGRWDPLAQAQSYTLTGALVIEEAERQAGRPITLTGGESFAWLTRAEVAALRTLGADAGVVLTLTLLDDTQIQCTPRRDGDGGAWLDVRPLAVVLDSGPANPTSTTRYVVEQVRLMEL